ARPASPAGGRGGRYALDALGALVGRTPGFADDARPLPRRTGPATDDDADRRGPRRGRARRPRTRSDRRARGLGEGDAGRTSAARAEPAPQGGLPGQGAPLARS